jgi:recombinational DNA repair protein (RecF pathway)
LPNPIRNIAKCQVLSPTHLDPVKGPKIGARIGKVNEYYTQALVLKRLPRNDKDAQFILYTKDLGKIYATAKSVRKITSKLAGHLRLGALVDARLVHRGGSFQLIDALSKKVPCQHEEYLRFVGFLDSTIPQREPDQRMWYTVREIVESCRVSAPIYRYLLQLMGFARSREASLICQGCGKSDEVVYFYPPDIIFLCSNCLSRVRIDINETVPVS